MLEGESVLGGLKRAEERLNEAVIRASERLEAAAQGESSAASSRQSTKAGKGRPSRRAPVQEPEQPAKRREVDGDTYREAVTQAARGEATQAEEAQSSDANRAPQTTSESTASSSLRTDEADGGASGQDQREQGGGAGQNSGMGSRVSQKKKAFLGPDLLLEIFNVLSCR